MAEGLDVTRGKDPLKRPLWISLVGILVYVFMLAPVGLVIWMSFFDQSFLSFPPRGYTLDWYTKLADQSQLFDGLLYSLWLAAGSAVLAVALGALAAIALARSGLPAAAWFESGFLIPLVVPAIVSGMALYIYLYQLSGVVGVALVPTAWSLLLAHTVITLPWTFRLIYAGLASIGRDVERASLDLGRTPGQTLWRVTLPLLRPSLIGATIFAFIFSFGDLEMSLFLVAPGQTTLPVAMVQYAAFNVDPTIAAVSTVQIVLIGGLLLLANKFVKFGQAFVGGIKQ